MLPRNRWPEVKFPMQAEAAFVSPGTRQSCNIGPILSAPETNTQLQVALRAQSDCKVFVTASWLQISKGKHAP